MNRRPEISVKTAEKGHFKGFLCLAAGGGK
jgi:hypothetical protein